MPGLLTSDLKERAALLALWAVPGVGSKTLRTLRAARSLGDLVDLPVGEWLGEVALSSTSRGHLARVPTLRRVAERIEERAAAGRMQVAWQGDPAYPAQLATCEDAPPLLFYRGHVDRPRRRLAMVGTRHPEPGFEAFATRFAYEVAAAGVGVVSGAALGVDQFCHQGAVTAGQPTWAFLGSALDEIDPAQAALVPAVLDKGGAFYSEFPPQVRAEPGNFPRRNRLISGASDAVLVLRAGRGSGAMHTVRYAHQHQRPVLALPGDLRNPAAEGCNGLLQEGLARVCTSVDDALRAVGLGARDACEPEATAPIDWDSISAEARRAYGSVGREPIEFEVVQGATRLEPAALVSALCELELLGLVIQRPGKRYERV